MITVRLLKLLGIVDELRKVRTLVMVSMFRVLVSTWRTIVRAIPRIHMLDRTVPFVTRVMVGAVNEVLGRVDLILMQRLLISFGRYASSLCIDRGFLITKWLDCLCFP